MKSKIPQYAQKVGEAVNAEKHARSVMYQWHASKGYKTAFKPVEHLGVRVYDLRTGSVRIEKITAGQKYIAEVKKHWKDTFGIVCA